MLSKRMQKNLLITDSFTKQARELRQYYDEQFADPRDSHSKRFVWDYWHLPEQYTLLRTPAYHYFPNKMYMSFHKQLVMWARQHLGCWDISPPWLSCYVDGCKQELHSDVPHGPWAYVFSLTPSKPVFKGGETLILKPETLSYWKNFSKTQDRELGSIVEKIKPKFNRLIVFDPRSPHGVTEVRGTTDPREGRLVIHGWFMNPKTYTDGFLPSRATEKKLNQAFDQVSELIAGYEAVQGTVSLRMQVSANGSVRSAKFYTNTLITQNGDIPADLNRRILSIYRNLEFVRARGSTDITVPLIVQ